MIEDLEGILDSFRIVQSRLDASVPTPARPWPGKALNARAIMLHGPRGVGKTSFLLRHARSSGGIYLSLDHPSLMTRPLSEWAEALFGRGVRHVYLDEVHRSAEWGRHLKALYDSYPGKSIWVSGSSSLLLSSGIADLSRRFLGVAMPYLSLREYLVLRGHRDYGVHDPLGGNQDWTAPILAEVNLLALFEEYLAHGLRPVFTEGEEDYGTRIVQVAQKTLEADIPHLVSPLAASHAMLMNAVLGYLAATPVPRLRVNSLCREWNVGKVKLYSLLHAMEQTGLIRIIRRQSDHAAMSIGSKIFLADPSLYRALRGKEGNAREAFVACAIQTSGRPIHSAPDEILGDFVVDNRLLVEIGGPRKPRKRSDLVIRDGTDWPAPGIVPLWCLGFMW